jgi:hypothetical protein
MTPLQRERFWASLHVRRIHPNAIRRGIYRTLGTRLLPWALAILAGGLVAAVGADVPGIAVGGAAQHGDRGCLLSLLESAQDEADWAKQAQLAPEHVRAEVERTVALRERVMRKPVVGPGRIWVPVVRRVQKLRLEAAATWLTRIPGS